MIKNKKSNILLIVAILLVFSLIANCILVYKLIVPSAVPEWRNAKINESEAARDGYNPDFMKIAIDIANENAKTGKGGPIGAVVVKDGKIIGQAGNQITSTHHFYDHAEICAMRNAEETIGKTFLSDCELYTSAQPCLMCETAIYWAKIKKVYYAASVEQTSNIPLFDDLSEYENIRSGKNLVPSVGVNVDGEMDALNLFKEKRQN